MGYRLRGPQSRLDLPLHRHGATGRRLPRWARPARRRRRPRPLPGGWTGPQHRCAGCGQPLLGRRMPDLDLVTADGPLRVFALLHDAKPVLLNFGEPGGLDIAPWAHRVQVLDAQHAGEWKLPDLGQVTAPAAVLVRPDGYVAWVGDGTDNGLRDALTTWFGSP